MDDDFFEVLAQAWCNLDHSQQPPVVVCHPAVAPSCFITLKFHASKPEPTVKGPQLHCKVLGSAKASSHPSPSSPAAGSA